MARFQFPKRSPAGTRRDKFRFEAETKARNDFGETVSTGWVAFATRRGSCNQVAYVEGTEGKQTVAQSAFEIVVPFVRYADGTELDGRCRIVWESGGGRVLYPTSVVGLDGLEHSIQASERTT